MIILLSPAKTLDFSEHKFKAQSTPRFKKESKILIELLKKESSTGIQKLMKVSEKIANLNVERYHNYSTRFTEKNSKAALLAFDGDVYKGLDAPNFTRAQMDFAEKHVRILSGLYGMLNPLDSLQAYRLEMGTKLKNAQGKNLYDFWGDKIAKAINKDLKDHKDDIVLNLASNEYFKSVDQKALKAKVVVANFKEYKGDDLKFISFNAKKARGLMTKYIVKNKIKSVEKIKGFDLENYKYSPDHSTEDLLMFVR